VTHYSATWLTQHRIQLWVTYQPASRYGLFQAIEFGWLIALSAILIAATVALIRRAPRDRKRAPMTASAAARPVRRALRVGLVWNAIRQHRLALIGLAIVFAGFGLRLALTGIRCTLPMPSILRGTA